MIVVNVEDGAAVPLRSAQLSSCLTTDGKLGTEEDEGLPGTFFKIKSLLTSCSLALVQFSFTHIAPNHNKVAKTGI